MNWESEVEAAAKVLREVVEERARSGEEPLMLVEFGTRFDEKYVFMRLDYVRSTAGALGYETARMRDPAGGEE